jgi:hypothetical protein
MFCIKYTLKTERYENDGMDLSKDSYFYSI